MPDTPPPPKPEDPPTPKYRPQGLTARQWCVRFVAVAGLLLVLGWAWQQAGMGEVGKLWHNRER
ncbi:MAG: hypothetical protein AAFU70_12065, partial [Planctomycetota bacterium]